MLFAWCLCWAVAVAGGAGARDAARALTGAARFAVSSNVLLGDAGASGAGGELGWRTQAQLLLQAQPHSDGLLLHFTLESPQLMLRGKHRNADFQHKPSVWDSMPSSSFLATWSEGHITAAYLDPADPPDVLNYKKALISLFQFQLEEGERNETDVSGFCHVHYESVSDLVFRKSKMQCTWQGAVDEDEQAELAGCERRRVLRVELAPEGELRALAADEVLLLRGTDPQHALKARALHVLTRAGGAGGAGGVPAQLELGEALARQPALAPHALPLEPRAEEPGEPEEAVEEVGAAVRRHGAAVEEARAGSAAAAAATLRLLPAVRAASAQQLIALLDHPDTVELDGLVRVLGLAGSRGAATAAREALQLSAARPPREALGRRYLAALSLAPEVDEWVVRDTLQLAGRGGALAGPARLASAAAAGRVPRAARAAVGADVQRALTKGLANCKEGECAELLLALGQLRRAELAPLLLRRAESGARAEALAAIAALADGPPEGYFGSARRRLEAIALGHGAARSLDVRAAALQLALRSAAEHPAALASMVGELRARGPRELRRVCWLRLRQLAETREELARLLPRLDPRPRDWFRRAYDGTSSVLERSAGWARLDSAQLASGGVLSRGRVQLSARAARAHRDLLTVELWTRGLESFASAPALPPAAREEEEGGEEEEEEAEGGLALTVAGVRTPDITLFRGQGELLGHIWAGTGSAPTPVLRAVVPRVRARSFALQAGVLVAGGLERAAAVALDAQAQVSLWGRTARAGLALRGAGAESTWLRVRCAWGHVSARAQAALEPALRIAAALDFYGAPQLCVHVALPDYTYTRNVTLASSLGDTRLVVRRGRDTATRVAGRTLALDAATHAACRALGAALED